MKKSHHLLEGLNPEQRKAVTHGRGPLLIIAGAGTGKTKVITHRIAYLISEKLARPEEILAVTFTEKAANEMEERVDVLIPYTYSFVEISTFNSFGERVLRNFALDLARRHAAFSWLMPYSGRGRRPEGRTAWSGEWKRQHSCQCPEPLKGPEMREARIDADAAGRPSV